MDPQKLSQLNPKLREAYQRVMGTPIPKPQNQPVSLRGEPVGGSQPEPEPISTPEPAITAPQPAIPQQSPIQANNFVQMNSEVSPAQSSPNFSTPAPMPQGQTMTIKKKSGMMMPVLFGIVGLIFIVIYALFWTKIFNLKLPFLP